MKKFIPFFVALFFSCNSFAGLQVASQLRLENLSSDNYQTTNSANQYLNFAAKINLISNFRYNKKWFFEINARVDQLSEAASGRDKFYADQGLYLREMRAGYDGENFALYAGKFRPYFGIAWRNGRNNWYDYTGNGQEQFDYNNTRGLWTDYIANNYAQTEKLGVSSFLKAGNASTVGKYELGFSAFTNDRKNFDNSIGNSRISSSKQDGSPGDVSALKSYVASLDVSYDFARDEKLFYRFAYINLAVNGLASPVVPTKIADQKGYVAAMNYQKPVSENINLNGLLEFSQMKNVGGNSDIGDNYLSSSLVANIYQNWNATIAYNARKHTQIDQNGFDQNMAEISAGYRFDKNTFFDSLVIQTGYRNLRTNNKTNIDVQNAVAILVRYIKNF